MTDETSSLTGTVATLEIVELKTYKMVIAVQYKCAGRIFVPSIHNRVYFEEILEFCQ